jgi:hypothetical protein
MTQPTNYPHMWKCVEAGMYDTTYECEHCDATHFEQADSFDHNRPIFGCVTNDFVATKLVALGSVDVKVTAFNGKMAICGDDEGCVLITREQAIRFFNIEEI